MESFDILGSLLSSLVNLAVAWLIWCELTRPTEFYISREMWEHLWREIDALRARLPHVTRPDTGTRKPGESDADYFRRLWLELTKKEKHEQT